MTSKQPSRAIKLFGTEEPVMAELDAHDAGKPGDRIAIAFDLAHFILIEPDSGKVLE